MYAVGKRMLLLFVLAALVTPLATADDPEDEGPPDLRSTYNDLQDLHHGDRLPTQEDVTATIDPDSDDAEADDGASGDEEAAPSSSGQSGTDDEPSDDDADTDDGPLAALMRQATDQAETVQRQAADETATLVGVLDRQVQEVEKARPTAELPLRLDLPSDEDESPQDTAPRSTSNTAIPITAAAVAATTAAAAGATMVFFWFTGSSASAGGSVAAAKGSATGARRVAPIFSPLFTRFEGKKVLEHPNREALYTQIATTPGVRLQDLCDATGLSRTAVTHHLRLLENQHLIMSKRVGRSRHYYENGGRFARDEKEAYAVLQNERSKAIATFIRSHPGAIQKHLCESLGVRPSIVHWHVKRLQEAHLVETVRQGRTVSYYPADAMARLAL